MPPFAYPIPTTALLTFSDVFLDPNGYHTVILANATCARTRMQVALRAASEVGSGGNWLAVVDQAVHVQEVDEVFIKVKLTLQAIQAYLPFLRGIMACLETDELLNKGDPIFNWRSALTHQSRGRQETPYALPGPASEYLFVLLSYSLALSNHALFLLPPLPTPENNYFTSKEQEKATTAQYVRCVELLCQASGLLQWMGSSVVLEVEQARAASGKAKWPLEASRDVLAAISMFMLADAHQVAIRKLLHPTLAHSLLNPGPPLPKSHPSPSLLAKLYLHVGSLYDSSRALLRIPEAAPSKLFSRSKAESENDAVEGDVIPSLKRYLLKESLLAIALAHKWMGIDAGSDKTGLAVAWLTEAKKRVEVLEESKVREKMKGLSLGLGKDKKAKEEVRKQRRGRIEWEKDGLDEWLKMFTRMNDTVSFQPVAPATVLQSLLPSGRPIVAAKAYTPPQPCFGPGSPGYTPAHGTPVTGDEAPEAPQPAAYAGKGAYF